MLRRRWALAAAGLGVAVALFAGIYIALFTPEDVPEESLGASPAAAAIDREDLPGTWEVASGSRAGYRVREKLARFPAQTDAVGRTTAVTGSMTIAEGGGGALVVSDVRFEADLTELRSDQDRRDNALRDRGLQTDEFPTATFSAGEVVVPADAFDGDVFTTTVGGELTLHGVTRPVELPIDARISGERIEVVGSLDVEMADYDIEPPDVAGIVTVEPRGKLEVRLFLERA